MLLGSSTESVEPAGFTTALERAGLAEAERAELTEALERAEFTKALDRVEFTEAVERGTDAQVRSRCRTYRSMAGLVRLVPAIPLRWARPCLPKRDARDNKPAHDEAKERRRPSLNQRTARQTVSSSKHYDRTMAPQPHRPHIGGARENSPNDDGFHYR